MIDAGTMLALAKMALEAIRKISTNATAQMAEDVADAILSVIQAVDSAEDGHVTPAATQDVIVKILADFHANDVAADAALAKRFPR
jgi:hypothetical protein